MARVKMTIECTECGEEFSHIHYSVNSREADSYREWANEHIKICPKCYRQNKIEEATKEFTNLPGLEGTEKQIKYALKLRGEFIKNNTDRFRDFYHAWEECGEDAKNKIKIDVGNHYPEINGYIAILVFSDAGKIINILK